jgi:hypothetical protein
VDRDRVMHLDKEDTMSLLDIYGHRWFLESIVEVIRGEETD